MGLQHTPPPVPNSLLPTLPTGPTYQDRKRIEDALDRSVSANTRRSYASAWGSLEEWTQARGIPSLPASPKLVAAYLLELAEGTYPYSQDFLGDVLVPDIVDLGDLGLEVREGLIGGGPLVAVEREEEYEGQRIFYAVESRASNEETLKLVESFAVPTRRMMS